MTVAKILIGQARQAIRLGGGRGNAPAGGKGK